MTKTEEETQCWTIPDDSESFDEGWTVPSTTSCRRWQIVAILRRLSPEWGFESSIERVSPFHRLCEG
jgi:hypothetical protein